MADVLLIGKDWKTRALVRAQLLEEGVEVEAAETVTGALESEDPAGWPRLIVADLSASDNPSEELGQLAPWSARIPIWVIASHSVMQESELEGRGLERVIFRPVQVGELVSAIRQRLERGK